MRLSTRSRYGTRVMLDLAQHPRRSVHLKEISERQGISLKYLEQIMMPLKEAGLVASSRGTKGGYRLARPASDISVGEIVSVLEAEKTLTKCETHPESCERSGTCSVRDLWRDVTRAVYDKLNGVFLSDLPAGKKARGSIPSNGGATQAPRSTTSEASGGHPGRVSGKKSSTTQECA